MYKYGNRFILKIVIFLNWRPTYCNVWELRNKRWNCSHIEWAVRYEKTYLKMELFHIINVSKLAPNILQFVKVITKMESCSKWRQLYCVLRRHRILLQRSHFSTGNMAGTECVISYVQSGPFIWKQMGLGWQFDTLWLVRDSY